jgi:hypothetical protein
MSRIRYEDMIATCDNPALLAIALSSPSAPTPEKAVNRQMQRHPGSMPGRGPGRPRLTEAEAVESKTRRRDYMRTLMREQRALAKFGAPSTKRHHGSKGTALGTL